MQPLENNDKNDYRKCMLCHALLYENKPSHFRFKTCVICENDKTLLDKDILCSQKLLQLVFMLSQDNPFTAHVIALLMSEKIDYFALCSLRDNIVTSESYTKDILSILNSAISIYERNE